MMKRLVGATALAGSLVLGLVTPANAEVEVLQDGRDTTAAQELVRVRIVHHERVKVVMKFSSNYHRDGEYPFSIFYDTNPSNPGPEFAFYSHFSAVYKVRGWQGGLEHEVDCTVKGDANWQKHTINISFGHRCFRGDSGPVQVNVAASGQADDASFVQDYAPGRHELSPPVSSSR